jgi:hypothetical protein
VKAFCAEELRHAGLQANPDQFELVTGTLEDAQETQAWARDEQQTLIEGLDRFDRNVSTWVACGVSLAARRDDDTNRVRSLVTAFDAVSRAVPFALEMDRFEAARAAIRGPNPTPAPTPSALARLEYLNSRLAASAAGLYAALGDVRHPMPDPGSPPALAEWCGFASSVLTVAPAVAVQRVTSVYWVLLGTLVLIAQRPDAAPAGAPAKAS